MTNTIKKIYSINTLYRIKRGGGGGGGPPIGSYFCQKAAFSVSRAYISLCAFAINEDGADKLSPLFKIFGSATEEV